MSSQIVQRWGHPFAERFRGVSESMPAVRLARMLVSGHNETLTTTTPQSVNASPWHLYAQVLAKDSAARSRQAHFVYIQHAISWPLTLQAAVKRSTWIRSTGSRTKASPKQSTHSSAAPILHASNSVSIFYSLDHVYMQQQVRPSRRYTPCLHTIANTQTLTHR